MSTSPQTQPPRPPAPPVPPRSSSNVIAIVLLGLALIVVVSGLVVWAGLHYLAHNFQVNERQSAAGKKEVEIKTPFGGINVNAGKNLNEASLGLPIYPGAKQVPDQDSASVNIGLPGMTNVRVVAGSSTLLTRSIRSRRSTTTAWGAMSRSSRQATPRGRQSLR